MFRRFYLRTVPATKCGHKTALEGRVKHFNGRVHKCRLKLRADGTVEYCLKCLAAMAVQCAWCPNLVLIGNPITLYSPRDASFVPPERAVVYSAEPLRLVGCLGVACALTGTDRAGFWVPGDAGQGQVKRVPTAFEQMLGGRLAGSLEVVASSGLFSQATDKKMIFPIAEEANEGA